MGLNMKLIRTICFLFIIIFSTQTIASVSIEEKVLIDSQVIKLGNIFNGLPNDLANVAARGIISIANKANFQF